MDALLNQDNEISIIDRISMVFFGLYAFLGVLINTEFAYIGRGRTIINLLRVAVFLVMMIDIIYNACRGRIKLKSYFLVFAILSGVIFVVSRNQQLLIFSLFFLWSSALPFKKLLKIARNIIFIALIFVVISSVLGIIPNTIYFRDASSRARYSFGFIAPTLPPAYFLFAVLDDLYLHKFRIPLWRSILYLAVAAALYYFTSTRLDNAFVGLSTIVGIIVKLATKKEENIVIDVNPKPYPWIWCLIPLAAFVLNVSLLVGYEKNISIFIRIADHLSRRVQYTLKAIQGNPYTLFGANIDWEAQNIILDSSFFKMIFEYGVVGFAMVLALFTADFALASKRRDLSMILILSLFALESIFEPFIIDYNYNLILMYFASTLLVESEEERLERIFVTLWEIQASE